MCIRDRLTDVAKAAGLKTIATNDFHYLTREDAKAQDYLLCISTGAAVNDANRMRFENDQFYMKSEEEMREALKDFPEACDTTVEVAEKCDVVLERDSILPLSLIHISLDSAATCRASPAWPPPPARPGSPTPPSSSPSATTIPTTKSPKSCSSGATIL